MFSFILQVFIESLLYAETGVGSKNSVVNETVVSACMELIVRWRGHDSQLATEINVQLFCDGNKEENTGCHDRETCVLWRFREGLPGELPCWGSFGKLAEQHPPGQSLFLCHFPSPSFCCHSLR